MGAILHCSAKRYSHFCNGHVAHHTVEVAVLWAAYGVQLDGSNALPEGTTTLVMNEVCACHS